MENEEMLETSLEIKAKAKHTFKAQCRKGTGDRAFACLLVFKFSIMQRSLASLGKGAG